VRGGPAAADGVAAPRGNSGAGGGPEVDPAGRLGDEPAPIEESHIIVPE
jgi:hypothetical protein